MNYSLIRGERGQKINPHFDPITDVTTTKLHWLKAGFLMERLKMYDSFHQLHKCARSPTCVCVCACVCACVGAFQAHEEGSHTGH